MAEKTMTVKEFVNYYKTVQNKDTAWNAIRLSHYIPFKLKADTALHVIKDNFYSEGGQIMKNTPALYVLNRMCAVTVYCPGMNINTDDALSDYDLLNESGVLEELLKAIGKDLEEFDTIFTMTYNDFIENTCSPQAYIHRAITTLTAMGNSSLDALISHLESSELKNMIATLASTKDDGK